MRKAVRILLATVLVLSAAACSSKPETKTVNGKGKGFGGSEISVTVTLEGDKITDLQIDAPNETPSIGGEAVEPLRQSILNAGTIEGVDGIAGATMTSNGIFSAIKNAIDPEANPYKDGNIGEQNISASGVTYGLGVYSSGRKGPGTDDTGTQVWSFNEVYANVMFDKEGRILAIYLDQMEVATPNYDGESMPHLSGFPGQGGYNEDSNHDEKVDGKTADTEEQFMNEVASWTTKRERGDGYQLSSNTWSKEADIYQNLFIGMTVDEVEEWYSKYCSDVNGRPLKITEKSKEEDVNKFNALSKEEQDMLVDLTSGATMSLNDGHGNIVEAIRKSYENRYDIKVSVK